MYLEDKITQFDVEILKQFPKDCDGIAQLWKIKMYGFCEIKWNQNDGHFLVHNKDGKVTYDDDYDVLIFHLPLNTESKNVQWGLGYSPNLKYEGKLVCLTVQDSFERVVNAMKQVQGCLFKKSNQDTETVLKNDVKLNLGPPSKTDPRSQGKNYPPGLKAFNIIYAFDTINLQIKEYIPPVVP